MENQAFITRVIELTNAERAKLGLSPLIASPQLIEAAQNHSEDMALRDYYDHDTPDGIGLGERIAETNYSFTLAAENIFAGPATPEIAVAGWMNSPSHRANILNPDLKEIGVGYYFLENDTGNVNWNHYWTQNFATPANTPSPVNSSSELEPDPAGFPRLLGQESADNISLSVGELEDFPDGVWLLNGNDTITGTTDDEPLFLNQGDDLAYAGAGEDIIYGGQQNDQIFGEDGNDLLRGDRDQDTLNGGAGDDILRGGKGDDILMGGDGADTLVGDLGQDTLTGGAGADQFVLRADEVTTDMSLVDVITDFDWFRDGDKIALTQGLTEADLDYTEQLDFDQEGIANDTVIRLRTTGEFLGIVLNADNFDLDGELVVAGPV